MQPECWLAAAPRYLHGSVPAFSGRKPKMGITAQQGQSKDWNLGWSPKLYPVSVCCGLPWWKQEALAPIPPQHCLGTVAGRYQQGFCSDVLICELKILLACKCLLSGFSCSCAHLCGIEFFIEVLLKALIQSYWEMLCLSLYIYMHIQPTILFWPGPAF